VSQATGTKKMIIIAPPAMGKYLKTHQLDVLPVRQSRNSHTVGWWRLGLAYSKLNYLLAVF